MQKILRFSFLIILMLNESFQKDDSLSSDQKKAIIRLHVFTSENNNKTFEIAFIQNANQTEFKLNSICDSKKSLLKFIIHGFAETWNMTNRWNWVKDMRNEMFKSNESSKLCIIIVDWKELARGGDHISNYWKAISNMKIAADLLVKYFSVNIINEKNMHCIGFSLGCHMCSMFYKVYREKLKVKPARITGLDPAGPLFKDKPLSEKLNFNDASIVDIIHTSEHFGSGEKLGRVDFYIDNGTSEILACSKFKDRFDTSERFILYEEEAQNKSTYTEVNLTEKQLEEQGGLKSLGKKFFNSIKNFFISKPKRVFLSFHAFFGCSHLMAVRLFIFSINECTFKTYFCSSLNDFKKNSCDKTPTKLELPRLGYYADRAVDYFQTYNVSVGSFFIRTRSNPPYCIDPNKKT